MKIIHVAVLEHNDPRREALEMLLNDTAGFNCSGKSKDSHEYLETTHKHPPDVLLLDVNIKCNNLNDLIMRIKNRWPDTKIIMQSNLESDLLSAAILSGADGYLHKKMKPDILLETIRKINGGAPVLNTANNPHIFPNMGHIYKRKYEKSGQVIMPVFNRFI